MKNKFLKISLIFSIFALIVSCDEADEFTGQSTQQASNTSASISLDFSGTMDIVETDNIYTYTITLSEPQIVDVKIPVTFVSGTASEHSDFDFDHEVKISKNTLTGSGTITTYRDMDAEDTESFTLAIGPGTANASVSTETINITLQDYKFCLWTLETSDTYGDGWNGGYVAVTFDGETTDYAEDDDVPTVFEIPITAGADFSIEYVSGGGTGGAPGWESENYFKLTAPDGTVWEEGTMDYSGIPTPGVIVSGTNTCP